MRALRPLGLLCTGVLMNVVSQYIADTDFADRQTHLIPWVKFSATLVAGVVGRWRASGPRREPSARQHRLMALIGALDAGAYTSFCLGFYALGATLSALLLAGLGQVLTALATRLILGRRLTWGQLLGISCVMAGLAARALPPSVFGAVATAAAAAAGAAGAAGNATASAADTALAAAASQEQLTGALLVAASAVMYSALGIAYDMLVKGAGAEAEKPPAHADIMWHTSKLGFVAASAYQLLYTLPRYDALVGKRMAASSVQPAFIVALLLAFGGLFNLHTFAQGEVFKQEGTIGVGLCSAVRGAVLSVVMGLFFCTPSRPHLCLTLQTSVSAAVTTLGGVIWVLSGAPAAPPKGGPGKRGKQPPSGKAAERQAAAEGSKRKAE